MGSHFLFSAVAQQEGAEEGNGHNGTSSLGRDDALRSL